MNNAAQRTETHFLFVPKSGNAGRVFREREAPNESRRQGRPLRVARMMALAIHLQGLIDSGKIKDLTTLADVGKVTRARVTQIMNLNLLAPDIQESILFLSEIKAGRDKLNEKQLRVIASSPSWKKQRQEWRFLFDSLGLQGE